MNLGMPLNVGTVSAIKALASSNRATYNEVFVHTARDSYGTLMEGREKGYTTTLRDRNGAVHEVLSPSKTPPLQPAYMDSQGKHKVKEAMAKLNAGIKGFWVEMPLEWGSKEGATPRAPANSPASIASIVPLTRELAQPNASTPAALQKQSA